MKKPNFVFKYKKSKLNKPKGTILMVPGFANHFSHYNKFVKLLTDYDIYMLSIPGGFEINCKPTYKEMNKMLRYDYIVNYVIDFIKAKKLKDFIMMGHCMGSGIVAMVENKCRNLITKLVFVAPICIAYWQINEFCIKHFPYKNVDDLNAIGEVLYKKQKEHSKSTLSSDSKKVIQMSLDNYEQLKFLLYEEIFTKKAMNKIVQSYKKIKTPLLICLSNDDPILPFNIGYKELKTLMPNAKYVIFNDSRHILFEEEHQKFTKVLKKFIDS